jgi:hypothetical protein
MPAASYHFQALGHDVLLQNRIATEEDAVILMEERQPVLLEGYEATIIGQAADAVDVLNFTAGDFRLETGQLADQVGKVYRRDLLNRFLIQAVNGVRHIETPLRAGRAGDDDLRTG